MFTRPLAAFLLVPALLTALTGAAEGGQKFKTLLDLKGKWKLEVGDDPRWADPAFPDMDWVLVSVPAMWETQGFPGYDGYGWYRKTFTAPADWANKRLYLDLGKVDDVDEVYLNGQFIGFNGSFPPEYETAYGNPRHYPIPPGILRPGAENLLAVRVYDSEMGGGIVHGPLQIVEDVFPLLTDQSLEGKWKFMKGDNPDWSAPEFNDRGWQTVRVPAFWETQGYRNYDGYGWYRLKFRASDALQNEHLILFLGKIDDFDEVYLNGQRIGRTGRFESSGDVNGADDAYQWWRAYTIPNGLLKFGADNTIAVRVYDKYMHGGIYEGPVGLVNRERYMKWESKYGKAEKQMNPWGKWLESLFN